MNNFTPRSVAWQLPVGAPATVFPLSSCSVELKWFEHAPGFVALLAGPDFRFVYANKAYHRIVGRDGSVGMPLLEALPELEGQGLVELLQGVVERRESYVECGREVRLRAPDGSAVSRYVDVLFQWIETGPGEPARILVQGSDVSMETIAQRGLQHSLTHDRLTGLPNYALFRDRLEQALQSVHGTRGGRTLAVVAIDLNRFNRVNVSVGHDHADRILYDIASRLKAAAGPAATVARDNGDKFLVLFEEDPQRSITDQLQTIFGAVSERITLAGETLYISCSAGIAIYPTHGDTAGALLLSADGALLQAKQGGAGAMRISDEISDAGCLEHFHLGAALCEALDRGDLAVHYQPQVDLVTGKISGVEALVRWSHPVKGPIPAARLISVAEDCGLIGRLGEWVLRTACAQMQVWRVMGYGDMRVAVNLSARQFAMRSLEEIVVRALAETGLPPACLDLELTESLLMVDVEQAIECLLALKHRGIRLSLDDFGTGYSSLAYLQRLPIDALKIDRSFLERVPEADDASAIVEAIITMGHSLGMRVVAEGVEHEAQCDFLARHMCDEIQGYYVARPMPAEELTGLLRREQALPAQLLRFNRNQPTLLLVDDEPSILSSLRRLLRSDGYTILTATSGQEGLALLAQHKVDVIVSDQRMPGMTGVEFLRSVKQLYPHTVRIVLSGFTELESVTDAVNAGAIYKFLTKPWDDAQLRENVSEAFSHGQMANENRLLTLEVRTANQQLAAVNRRLEEVLARQLRQIERGEISLDIVREALSNVPVPVLACDDVGTIVLANRAALHLFRRHGAVLGGDAQRLFGDFPAAPEEDARHSFEIEFEDMKLAGTMQPMGHGTPSRGWLIAITDGAGAP